MTVFNREKIPVAVDLRLVSSAKTAEKAISVDPKVTIVPVTTDLLVKTARHAQSDLFRPRHLERRSPP
jgi:hypothetical protein